MESHDVASFIYLFIFGLFSLSMMLVRLSYDLGIMSPFLLKVSVPNFDFLFVDRHFVVFAAGSLNSATYTQRVHTAMLHTAMLHIACTQNYVTHSVYTELCVSMPE